jgi:hypothetical protein
VNPGNYTQAGRLSQDDAARERMKQVDTASTRHLEGRPHSQLKGTTSGDAETDPADEAETEKDNIDEEDEPEDSSEE